MEHATPGRRHLPTKYRWGKNERKLLILLMMQDLSNPTINELHQYLHQVGKEAEYIARSTLEKLMTRYRVGGLVKRKKTPRLFKMPYGTQERFEYRYSITNQGLAKISWLLEQKKDLFPPDEIEPEPEPSKFDIKELLWALLLKKQMKKG